MVQIEGVKGTLLERGAQGYEDVRQAAAWQYRKPDRYPDLIVRVKDENDVVAAVRYAREHGLRVKALGGGHSYTNSGIRDGLLIDFTDFQEVAVDPEARTATVTPSVRGNALNAALYEHGLFFPTGHCPEVGLGGFLLQGGFGWNASVLGMSCSSVEAIDVVTADGELIHADENSNSEYLWAARGAGPGFFGVVTRFHLRLYPMPASLLLTLHAYPMDAYDDAAPFFLETVKTLPRFVEPFMFGMTPPDSEVPLLFFFAVAYADTEEEGRAALAPLESCPAVERALVRRSADQTTWKELYDFMAMGATPGRWAVDGLWTEDPVETIAPVIRDLIESMPTAQTTIFVQPWKEVDVPNAAFSLQAPLYISLGCIWQNEEDDERLIPWPGDQVRRLEQHAVGIQLAEENLINRAATFMAPENMERLEQLRKKYDPDGLFHSYLR